MEEYAGRVLADRYRLPLPVSGGHEPSQTRAFDTYSGQEVLVRQVQLPEVVDAEVLGPDGSPAAFAGRTAGRRGVPPRDATDPLVRRAIEVAQAAAQVPDHPRLDQVFNVFAEDGSLWIVSEHVPARSLAAMLTDGPLSPYRAAEVAADLVTALRALHAHGWVHRNITARTVLVCDDGRVVLTGLAAGAAEDALCGYDPRPEPADDDPADPYAAGPHPSDAYPTDPQEPSHPSAPDAGPDNGPAPHGGRPRAGSAVAAYQAGTRRAVARLSEEPPADSEEAYDPYGEHPDQAPSGEARPAADDGQAAPPGQIADPYGVHGTSGSWHGAAPRGSRQAEDDGESGGRHGAPQQQAPRPPAPGSNGLPPLPVGWDPDPSSGAQRRGGEGEFTSGQGQSGYGSGLPYEGSEALTPEEEKAAADRAAREAAHDARMAAHRARTAAHDSWPDGPADDGGTGPSPAAGRPATAGPRTESAAPQAPHDQDAPAGWDGPQHRAPRRGPATALAAERARQARMTVVGPVTERWAPEQAVPVHENWQLAAPIGPATDLWALGALLFRAVQGHAPYPEESTAELVQLVCAEPPAYAEECGPLRPVVESLLRQDPTERLDFEELRGWLRSLVRSAPEPEAGAGVVPGPPADPHLLPIKRRRGELVRRWRRRGAAKSARHKQGRAARTGEPPVRERHVAHEHAPVQDPPRRQKPVRAPREPRIGKGSKRPGGEPRSLGRTLLMLILLGLGGAVAFAMLFLPESEESNGGTDGSGPEPGSSAGQQPGPTSQEQPGDDEPDGGSEAPATPGSEQPQTTSPELPAGYVLRKDQEGFQVGVPEGWQRQPKNGRGQVRYVDGDFTLLLTPGRDSTATFGQDPMAYQREREYELQPFRDSTWATSSGMRSIDVGGRRMAEGQFTWQESDGREVYVRNLAMVFGGRYHVLQVIGPEAQRDEVTRVYEQASASYRYTG